MPLFFGILPQIAGGTGQSTLTSGGTSGSASPALSSGTYTPTTSSVTGTFVTNGVNIPAAWKWHRVGNTVVVSGFFNVSPSGSGVGTFTATLPTTTANFSGSYDAAGSLAAINLNWGGCVVSNNGAQTVKVQGQPNAINSTDVGFTFQYEVK